MFTRKTIAAGHYLERLEGIVLNRTSVNDSFFIVVEEMQSVVLVGTKDELKRVRRLVVEDAVGLKEWKDSRVRKLVRHLATTSKVLAPRAASVNGAVAGHRFGVDTSG